MDGVNNMFLSSLICERWGWDGVPVERVALLVKCVHERKGKSKTKLCKICDLLTSCSTCSNGKCDDDEELDVCSWIRKVNVFPAFKL